MVPPPQCCTSMYYIEMIWLFTTEYTWLLLHTFATKATLALIKYKFDSRGLLNISPCPLISIAQGHFITVLLVLMKLIISIENKISTVYNTAYMHIRCTTASNEAPFSMKLTTFQYAYHTPKLCHYNILWQWYIISYWDFLSLNVSLRTVFAIIHNEITVKYCS
jgi:hypothetical protein